MRPLKALETQAKQDFEQESLVLVRGCLRVYRLSFWCFARESETRIVESPSCFDAFPYGAVFSGGHPFCGFKGHPKGKPGFLG